MEMNFYKISKKKTRVNEAFAYARPYSGEHMNVTQGNVTHRFMLDYANLDLRASYFKLQYQADDVPTIYLNGVKVFISLPNSGMELPVDCMYSKEQNHFYFTDDLKEGDQIMVEYITRDKVD